MKGKNISLHNILFSLFFMIQVFLCMVICYLMRMSNIRYRNSIFAIYHLLEGQMDSNSYMNLLLDVSDKSAKAGLQRLMDQGYTMYAMNQVGLWKGSEIMVALAGVCALSVVCVIIYWLIVYKRWKEDQRCIDCVSQGIMSGEVSERECHFKEHQDFMDMLYHIGILNRKKEFELQKERHEVMEILENVAHQMKTPLAGVQMYLEVLCQSESLPENKNKLIKCHQSVEALEQMVFRILRMARLDSGRVSMQLENESIRVIWEKACKNNQYLMEKKNIDLILEGDIDMLVCCDSFWTEEALSNVINNALAYTESGKKVRGVLKRTEHELELCIINEGIRIPTDQYDLIFERFFHRGKEHGGDGIGLHMARTIMQIQGGTLTLRPVADGNCFVLVFQEVIGKAKRAGYETNSIGRR